MVISELHQQGFRLIEEYAPRLIDICTELYEHPEIAYEEHHASQVLSEAIKEFGFDVIKPAVGIDTAFIAKKSSKKKGPTIAILAEYDALPGLGHGCGHNLIAASSLGGAAALGSLLDELGGTLYLLGTPAEEGGGGKIHFCNHDIFNDIDVVYMGHPSGSLSYWTYGRSSLCVNSLRFTFKGRAAHAAMDPYRGINALDAVIQTFNAVSALRQQTRPTARIHGIITKGGAAPNIIPDLAEAFFFVRNESDQNTEELTTRVINCARGAESATGTQLKVTKNQGYRNLIPIDTLDKFFGELLDEMNLPHKLTNELLLASTDLGNVSHLVPTLAYNFPIVPEGTMIPLHSSELAKQTIGEFAQKVLIDAAKVNVAYGINLILHPEIIESAKQELSQIRHEKTS